MKIKLVLTLIMCLLFIGCASTETVSETGNYVRNGDFSRFGSEWPNLPHNWSTT